MVSDDAYEAALPVLQDDTLDEEEQTDRLEELLRKQTGLTGKSLENIVLDCLWRFRDAGSSSSSPPRAAILSSAAHRQLHGKRIARPPLSASHHG